MSKLRNFSIVFHNVKDGSKTIVEKIFSNAQKIVLSQEPYPEDNSRYHLHLFLSLSNPRSFKSVLGQCEDIAKKIKTPTPEGETRDWGRVQVDKMKGTFEQATAYLSEPGKKNKPVDEKLIVRTKNSRTCDICKKVFELNSVDHGYDYPDCSTGRCYRCYLTQAWLKEELTLYDRERMFQDYLLKKIFLENSK